MKKSQKVVDKSGNWCYNILRLAEANSKKLHYDINKIIYAKC